MLQLRIPVPTYPSSTARPTSDLRTSSPETPAAEEFQEIAMPSVSREHALPSVDELMQLRTPVDAKWAVVGPSLQLRSTYHTSD
jgi:hypothetical protein